MMKNDDVVDVLNSLIETCNDGAKGFETSADMAKAAELKSVFTSRAADCRRWFATALLASLHSALRFAAAGLGLVISIQFYFLSGG
jgi:hypothetical protein